MAVQIPISVDVKNADKAGRDLDKIGKEVVDLGKNAESTSDALKGMLAQTAAFAGISLGAAGLKEFGSKMIEVRKEMQTYQTSLNVLLGDQSKANAMFSELKDFAVKTPLMFKDLAAGAQTMLGFNIEAEKVVPTLKAIGDISMGDSQKFNSLTLAFSQMSATGKLMGQDLLQMINAGFNPLLEISRKTGKSISDLKTEMSNGAISAQMVADAFKSATEPGGQFFGMIEAQGKTLTGQINTMKGAIDDMFNSLGEQSEGAISKAISGITTLAQNYETVGRVIVSLITTYGAYKAALITTNTIEAIRVFGLKEGIKYISLNTVATKAATAAQAAYNAVLSANPFVLVATAAVAYGTAMWTITSNMKQYVSEQNQVNNIIDSFNAKLNEEKSEAKSLISVIQSDLSTKNEQQEAYDKLKTICGELTDKYSLEKLAVLDLKEAYEQLEGAQIRSRGRAITDTKERIRNMIQDVKNAGGAWGNLNADTTSYLEENGYTGKSLKEVEKKLRKVFFNLKTEEELNNSRTVKKESDSEEVENKETLEKKKNAKEAELAKLSEVAALGKEGDKLRKEIAEYDKRIEKAYGTKKTTKKDHKNEDEEKLGDLVEQQQKDKERAAYDQEFAIEQARINGLRDGSAKVRAQLDLDYEKEMEIIGREEQDLLKQREDAARKLWEAENPEKVRKGTTWQSSGEMGKFRSQNRLTDQDKAYFAQRRKAAKDIHDRGIEDQQIADDQYMLDYLQKYGTFQQQREAVTKDYQNRINKALEEGNEWLAKDLTKQWNEALSNIDMESLKLNINWEAVFGDLSKYTNSQLKTLRDQLKAYKLSDNYVKGTEENRKIIDEAIMNVGNSIASSSGIFGGLADGLKQLSDAQKELSEAEKEVIRTAFDTEANAAAKKRRATAQQGVDNAEANLRNASRNTVTYVSDLASTITQLGTSSEMTISDLGNLVSSIAGAFGETGQKIGGIIGAVFSVADMIAKDGIEGLFKNVGDLVGGVLGGLFGFDINESQHRYEKEKKINDNYIQMLNDVIGKQEEIMKRQSAMDVAESAVNISKDYDKIQELALKNVQGYLDAGASAGFLGIGSSSSHGVDLRKEISGGYQRWGAIEKPEALKQYEAIFGELNGRTAFGEATIEQIKAVSEALDLWSMLPDEVKDYYQQILNAQDALEKMTETTNEMVTGYSFDNLHDSYLDSLMDMDKKTKDFADNFSKYMMKAALDSKIKEGLDSQLLAWQTEWQKRMTDDNRLDDNDVNVLRSMWDDIMDQGIEIRDSIAKVTGYGSSQALSATQRSVASTSEETASEINGRFTSIQISNQEISNKTSEAITHIIAIGTSLNESNSLLNDINLSILAANGYLGQIYSEMIKGFENSYARMGEFISTINTKL